jgi:hypothetical protein
MFQDAIMTKMDVRRADRVDRRDWMVGDQSPRGLDFLGNLITERLDVAPGWGNWEGTWCLPCSCVRLRSLQEKCVVCNTDIAI